MLRILLSFVLLLSVSASALAAGALRVGMSADYPPLHYKHDKRLVGIEPDNAVSVGKIIDRKIELVEIEFDELIPALLAGKIDVIMSGFSVTAARSEQVMFSDPYLRMGQMAIMHKDKIGRFAQPWAIYSDGIRVGVEPGTTGEAFARRDLTEAVISGYEDAGAAFDALRSDKIDLYIHDAPTSWQLANSGENSDMISLYKPLTEEQLAWAIRPGEHELLVELNRALSMMRASGTLTYILNRWIPVQVEVR
ncbi:MAG: transporter substrate-binding domain-containing protein [Halioglobus sp.]